MITCNSCSYVTVVWIGNDGAVVGWFRFSIPRNIFAEVMSVTILMRSDFHYSLLYRFRMFN